MLHSIRWIVVLVLFSPLFLPALPRAQAATPEISSVFGSLIDGGSVRLMGSAFGEHGLDIASGVGPGGWIEENRAGTPIHKLKGAGGWTRGQATPKPAKISKERAHSGEQSMLARVVRSEDYWQSVMLYSHPHSFDEIWLSFWYWFDPIHTSESVGYSANKWFRIGDATVNNSCAEIYTGARWTGDVPGAANVLVFCGNEGRSWKWRLCYEGIFDEERGKPLCEGADCSISGPNIGSPMGQSTAQNFPTPRQWTRVVVRAKASDLDVANGEFFFSVHKPEQLAETAVDWSGVLTHSSECSRGTAEPWQHFQFQNYFDDNVGSDMQQRADFFYDDIYLQFGTQARVELGDRPVYEDCTRLEIQTPRSWSSAEIEFELNRGSFQPGEVAYLFVVDQDGAASGGFSLTLE